MNGLKSGDKVKIPRDARGLFGERDRRAGQTGRITGVHDREHAEAYNVRFDQDGETETMLAEKVEAR